MSYAVLADLVLLAHALFVLFIFFGGLAVLHRPGLAVYHLPALVWAVAIDVGDASACSPTWKTASGG